MQSSSLDDGRTARNAALEIGVQRAGLLAEGFVAAAFSSCFRVHLPRPAHLQDVTTASSPNNPLSVAFLAHSASLSTLAAPSRNACASGLCSAAASARRRRLCSPWPRVSCAADLDPDVHHAGRRLDRSRLDAVVSVRAGRRRRPSARLRTSSWPTLVEKPMFDAAAAALEELALLLLLLVLLPSKAVLFGG